MMTNIWLSGYGVYSQGKETLYNVSMSDLELFSIKFYPEIKQIHFSMSREELRTLYEVIGRELK